MVLRCRRRDRFLEKLEKHRVIPMERHCLSRETFFRVGHPRRIMLHLRFSTCRAVKPVKPLGCLAMIDDGELDWKVGMKQHASWSSHGLCVGHLTPVMNISLVFTDRNFEYLIIYSPSKGSRVCLFVADAGWNAMLGSE